MDNLSTVDKLTGPNVSIIKRFHCSMARQALLVAISLRFMVSLNAALIAAIELMVFRNCFDSRIWIDGVQKLL